MRTYRLLGPDGFTYESRTPGQLGGYRPKRIYGRLDCTSANRHLSKGGYAKHRVFFADRAAAVEAGYRPCGHCLKAEYKAWKLEVEQITRQHFDDLLRFLPILEHGGKHLEVQWKGGEKNQDGISTFRYPLYPDAVVEFFRIAGLPFWDDAKYKPTIVGRLIESDQAIASASLAQIKSMVTYCVRGERFCDGHWIAMIQEGRIVAILRRLEFLRSELGIAASEQ